MQIRHLILMLAVLVMLLHLMDLKNHLSCMWLCTYIFNIFLFTHNVTVLSSYRPHDGVYIFPICCPLSPRLHCDWLVSSDWLVCRQTGRQRQSVAWGQWAGRWGFIRLVSRHGKAQHGIRVTWSLLAHLTQCVLTQGSVCERESVLVFFVFFLFSNMSL